jgi:hypothetical protein
MPLGALPPKLPASWIVGALADTVWFGPALAVATALIVTTTCADPAKIPSLMPVVVSVKVTVPAVISSADGLYVAFSVVSFGAKLPVPEEVQMPPVAPSPTVPPNPAVSLPAQIVWLPAVLAEATRVMDSTTCAVAPSQGAS